MINFSDPKIIVDFILGLILYIALVGVLVYKIRKRALYIGAPITLVVISLAYIFQLQFLLIMSVAALITLILFVLFVNANEFRYFVLKNTKYRDPKLKHNKEEEISKEETYRRIAEAVKVLSKQKIGAIITIEKNQNLDSAMKNGTIVNAPVTSELLMTIFYPGTRLHDGAVIIRGNKIVAASVYYSPTTKALQGKFGSRHRAAVGISEISDAVTIVVSEETGIISIAYKAQLEHSSYDVFYDEFTALLEEE